MAQCHRRIGATLRYRRQRSIIKVKGRTIVSSPNAASARSVRLFAAKVEERSANLRATLSFTLAGSGHVCGSGPSTLFSLED
jgi:hypothetical protein